MNQRNIDKMARKIERRLKGQPRHINVEPTFTRAEKLVFGVGLLLTSLLGIMSGDG